MPENISILDNIDAIQQLDKSNVLGSIQALALQVEDAWEQVQELQLDIDTAKVRNVVVSGMGGSALGPDVIKRCFKKDLKVPFEVVNDYALPGYVDEHSLVVVSSYSGTTEETVASLEDARSRGAQILVVSTGGNLRQVAEEQGYGIYVINPTANPSNQPRMAIGYSVFGIIALLQKVGLFHLDDSTVNAVIATIRRTTKELNAEVPQSENAAKLMAFQILGRIPVFVAAEHLEGAVHVVQNQFNENGKTYSEYRVLPELNHHLMEGLRFPQNNDKSLFYVLFQSNLYHQRTQRRVEITQTVIEQAGIDCEVIELNDTTGLEQVFEVITFGAFANFYLAMLEGVDPAPIAIVDFFKEELNKA